MFRRKAKVPKLATYATEAPHVQLRIIRTHIAAQTSELANLRFELGRLADALDRLVTK